MKTLVAAPIGRRKAYSLDAWAATTEGHDRLLATDEEDFAMELTEMGIPVVTYRRPEEKMKDNLHPIYGRMFTAAWRAILENAGDHTHILSLESDVSGPPNLVETMEKHYKGGFLCHGVPWRAEYHRKGKAYEMGCTLASVDVWQSALSRAEFIDLPLYTIVQQSPPTRINIFDLIHAEGPENTRFVFREDD